MRAMRTGLSGIGFRLPFRQVGTILRERFPALRAKLFRVERLATVADLAHHAAGHAEYQRMRRDVCSNDGAGADERVLPNGDPANDRHVRPEARPFPHAGFPEMPLGFDERTRPQVVREYSVRPHENIILQPDEIPQRDSILDRATAANLDVIL